MVVVISVGLLGLNIWGFYNLKQDYNDNWFFPSDSYAHEFNEMKDKYFPGGGAIGGVYCSKWGQCYNVESFKFIWAKTFGFST